MILARGARLLLAGTAIGLLASVAAGRWLAGAVWRVSGVDPLAFAAVAALLMIVGLAACTGRRDGLPASTRCWRCGEW